MDNQETTKILAKSKVKLTAAVLLMAVIAGGLVECARAGKPTAEAVVIYRRDNVVVPMKETAPAPVVAAKSEDILEKAPAKGISAEEFVDYLQGISARAVAISKPESALEKIVLPQKEVEILVEEGVSEEIVIYDGDASVEENVVPVETDMTEAAEVETVSEEEVVSVEADEKAEVSDVEKAAVVEEVILVDEGEVSKEDVSAKEVKQEGEGVVKAETPVTEEESVAKTDASAEPIVNTEENAAEVNEIGEDAPTIDMMKDIIEREQAVGKEK